MELIYAYIENFRNIINQEISFSPSFQINYDLNTLRINRHTSDFQAVLFTPNHISSIHLIVGKTGSGKSNLLTLISMTAGERQADMLNSKQIRYFFLYHTGQDHYFLETVRYHFDEEGHLRPIDNDEFQCHYCQLTKSNFLKPTHQPFSLPKLYTLNTSASSTEDSLLSRPPARTSLKTSSFQGVIRQHCTLSDNRHYVFAHLEKYLQDLKSSGESSSVFNKNLYCNIWINGILPHKAANNSSASLKKRCLEFIKMKYFQYLTDLAALQEVPYKDISNMKNAELNQYYHMITDGSVYSESLKHTFLSLDTFRQTCKVISDLPDYFFNQDCISWEIGTIQDNNLLSSLSKLMSLLLRWTHNDRPDISDIFHITYTNLSTGEYQFVSLLANIEQICQTADKIHTPFIILIDEPETFLHPELCRQFISHLFQICAKSSSNLVCQFILTSHSPFLLSDLPSECVTRISIDTSGKCRILKPDTFQTFGSNIHQLLADGFFLDSTLGAYSSSLISQMSKTFTDLYNKQLFGKTISQEEAQQYKKLKSMIPYIGDPIIRKRLQEISQFTP